jgi:hypothetical protein
MGGGAASPKWSQDLGFTGSVASTADQRVGGWACSREVQIRQQKGAEPPVTRKNDLLWQWIGKGRGRREEGEEGSRKRT